MATSTLVVGINFYFFYLFCYVLFWYSESSTPRNSNCTATCLPSHKSSNTYMLGTIENVTTKSFVTFSNGLLHTDTHVFTGWFVHIHYKLIFCCLCSAEQNNKASWKNNHERFILMTESKLVSEWEKFFWLSQIAAVSQVTAVIFGEDRQCWSVQ